MDLIAHYCYQPFGSMSDAQVSDSKKTIRLATLLWKRLMPTIPMKVHAWQHLAEDLERYRGLKTHNEEAMERAHQAGMKDDYRLHAVRNFKVKTLSVLKNSATVAQDGVKEMLEDTEAKRKRKKRKATIENEIEAKKDRAAYLRSILLLPEMEDEFPSF